jgi:glutamate-1-semialdehyde 2,1-aminomutase
MNNMKTTKSLNEYKKAIKLIPGGVNSPVRAFKNVGLTPRFIKKGKGNKIWDIDNNIYTDYCMSWGALLFGHSRDEVISDVIKQSELGTSYGAATSLEVDMAELVVNAIPYIEMIRFVNSGTEAVMSAIRLARGFSKRDAVVKFDGCYHGHSDSMLINAGSGVSESPESSSLGITKNTVLDTFSLPYNDIEIFKNFLKKNWRKIGCVIVEPVAANMGVVTPEPEFLNTLREETERYGIVLIFDEVITGFRTPGNSAGKYFKITPDITCLGKIIGGGFPVAAFGGKREIMSLLAPLGDVYQAGTLSGNPVAMAAGISTMKLIKKENPVEKIKKLIAVLEDEKFEGISISSFETMFTVFFNPKIPRNYDDVKKSDTKKFAKFFYFMLENGVYLSPSQFEADFLSYAHTDKDIKKIVELIYRFFKKI